MIRISLPYIYELGVSMHPLSGLEVGTPLLPHLYDLFNAEVALNAFLYQSIYSESLRVCQAPGQTLIGAIRTVTGNDVFDRVLEHSEVIPLANALNNFQVVLKAELMTANSYFVTSRRGYDIKSLIENAEIIFPKQLIEKIPTIQFDLREAGKCIAFDLGTAAGFHLLRALETVICRFWHVVMEGAPLPENRNLGSYIKEMEKAKKAEGKVLTALRQIKDFHRTRLCIPKKLWI